MLVYPTETAEWAFLDKHYIPEVKLPVSLRCVVFRSIPEFFDDKTGELSIKNDSLKLVDDAPLMNRLFRETFGLEYKALVSREKKGSDVDHDTFFIIYPSFKEDEHDLIVSFLEANNATVYSSYTTGAWDYVLKEVHDAIILVSEFRTIAGQALISQHRSIRSPQLFIPFHPCIVPLSPIERFITRCSTLPSTSPFRRRNWKPLNA